MERPSKGNLFTIDCGALVFFLDVSKASNSAARAIPFLTFTTLPVWTVNNGDERWIPYRGSIELRSEP